MNEIAEEIGALIELKREASRGQFPIEIKVGCFNKWSKIEKAFSRSEWQQNLKDLIIAKCTVRIAELELKKNFTLEQKAIAENLIMFSDHSYSYEERKNYIIKCLLTFKKEENVNKCK